MENWASSNVLGNLNVDFSVIVIDINIFNVLTQINRNKWMELGK